MCYVDRCDISLVEIRGHLMCQCHVQVSGYKLTTSYLEVKCITTQSFKDDHHDIHVHPATWGGGGGGVMSKPWLNWVIRAGVGMHGVVDN